MLMRYDIPIAGQHVVIIGRGLTIGRPLANLLSLKRPNANAAVTVVHTGAGDISRFTRTADILIAAAGSPRMVTADMVKPGAAVVAAGSASPKASWCPMWTTGWPRWPAGFPPESAGWDP